MTEPYIGQISMVAFNFAPRSWALCNGQLMSIAQNTALFSLIGTTYGGDGRTTFALPNLQSRIPLHKGTGPGLTPRVEGESSGSETVTLVASQMPSHNHLVEANGNPGGQFTPINGFWAAEGGETTATYAATANGVMNANAISNTGGSQPHNNMQPYLVIAFVIALYGYFPPRS
ncbi:MAG: phage tail protein [Candidatus Kapaibacterium sp.]